MLKNTCSLCSLYLYITQTASTLKNSYFCVVETVPENRIFFSVWNTFCLFLILVVTSSYTPPFFNDNRPTHEITELYYVFQTLHSPVKICSGSVQLSWKYSSYLGVIQIFPYRGNSLTQRKGQTLYTRNYYYSHFI